MKNIKHFININVTCTRLTTMSCSSIDSKPLCHHGILIEHIINQQ